MAAAGVSRDGDGVKTEAIGLVKMNNCLAMEEWIVAKSRRKKRKKISSENKHVSANEKKKKKKADNQACFACGVISA